MMVETMGAAMTRTGRKLAVAFALMLALGAESAFAAAPETATAGEVSGSATLVSAGKSSALRSDSKVGGGDVVKLDGGAKATIAFEDGASLSLVGPAELSFVEVSATGRRLRLVSGEIAELDIRGVATEVQTPSSASLVLQGATASATVAGSVATFTKHGGSYAKVWRDGRSADLSGTWSSAPAAAAAATPGATSGAADGVVVVEVIEVVELTPSTETASVASVAGRATVERGGDVARVNAATVFEAGDVVRVASGSRLTIRYVDGSSIALSGPAELQFVEMNPDAYRVMLRSGVISESYSRGVATEVQTPYDASLVLQNSTGYARVRPGDRVAFQKLDGDLAQVYHQERFQDLSGGWTLNVRSGDLSTGAVGMGAGTSPANMRRFSLNGREIAYGPPEDFVVEVRSSGGVRLAYNGDDYGVVKVGPHSTVFFLAGGEAIEFDENGNVVAYDGISHIYHPLTDVIFYDEPVENAADASISGPGRR